MNRPFKPGDSTPFRITERSRTTTQAAEGLPRWRWTVTEVEAMVEAGILLEDDRFELIGGEMVPMAAKGIKHEQLKGMLSRYWYKRIPDHIGMITETTFRFNEDTFVEPDFLFFRSADGLAALSPKTALLAVEVADSSLSYDRDRKALLYALQGMREVWVIDAVQRIAHVYRQPGLDGYGEVGVIPADGVLMPDFAPELAVTLSTLDPI